LVKARTSARPRRRWRKGTPVSSKAVRRRGKQYRFAYKRWPDSPLEEEAIYKCAESEFFDDHYMKADDEYGLLVKKFNSTQYLSMVVIRRFAIGRYWEQCDAGTITGRHAEPGGPHAAIVRYARPLAQGV